MLVSIYMPTRNRVALLKRAVDSVLSQTHRELELWVVDDGSTDATQEYLQCASAADPRLHVLRNEQSVGAPRSRNLAIAQSRGEFITGLDDDDSFHERRIEKLLQAWQQHERAGTRFSCLFTQDLETSGTERRVSKKPAKVEYEALFFYNLIGNQIFTRRESLIGAGMFDEHMPAWQDLDLFMRVLKRYGPALLVDEPLYVLELAPTGDRISMSAARVNAAYERLATKVTNHAPVLRQGLFLQRFGKLYGYGLSAADLREFWQFGLHARTLKRMAGILMRQALSGRRRIATPSQSRAASGRGAAPRVLMFPKHGDNPYLRTLSESLERRGARIEDFNFRRAFTERYDVVHIHWPDLHLHARSPLRAVAKHVRLALLFAVLRFRKSRIVWTVHNLKPHERHHRLGEMLFPIWFPRLCTHVIALTMSGLESARGMYPALRNKSATVIPHGHYRGAYDSAPTRASCRDRLGLAHRFTFLFFGNIRPYKNVPLLIEAFRALPRQDVQLVIAGQPGRMMEVEELKQLAAEDERIRLSLEFVPKEDVPLYMGASDVVVLPFGNILNSGSVFLALSFNRAVLAPRLGSLPEIQSRVGPRWVNLYDGPLSTKHLLQTMSGGGIAEHETADLSAYDWDSIGQQTLDFYLASDTTSGPPLPAKRVSALPDTR
jgi:beta-1,4-mannosyltransferase